MAWGLGGKREERVERLCKLVAGWMFSEEDLTSLGGLLRLVLLGENGFGRSVQGCRKAFGTGVGFARINTFGGFGGSTLGLAVRHFVGTVALIALVPRHGFFRKRAGARL